MVFKSSKKDDKRAQEPVVASMDTAVQTAQASFVGKTMDIQGDLSSEEDVTVEGRIKGNIDVGKTLTIGKNGKVEADIRAAVVRIIGEARGNITASQKVEILAQGRYTGNIKAEKLVVAEGAILNGQINQGADDQK